MESEMGKVREDAVPGAAEGAVIDSDATHAAEAKAETFGDNLPRPRVRTEHLASEEQAKIAGLAALDRKATELRVLDVARSCDFTDYFVICSGSNERQVQAIADAIQEAMFRQGIKPLHVEGLTNARWVLLDFGGDFVAHVFLEEARRFYNLERLWSDARDITASVGTPKA
jgi:ribosome-associated protein